MTVNSVTSPLDADARRLALEVIATLAYVKKIAADQILRPAGVPTVLIQHFVKGRDTATGDPLTKRQGGAHILEELARKPGQIIRLFARLSALRRIGRLFILPAMNTTRAAWSKRRAN